MNQLKEILALKEKVEQLDEQNAELRHLVLTNQDKIDELQSELEDLGA